MEKKLFSIGEIAQIKGITKKALRFYERIGLLKPAYVNPSNGYRFYSIEQFIHMDIIKAMRFLDISPMAIKAVFKNQDTSALMAFLDTQKDKTAQKINDLRKMSERISRIQNSIQNSQLSIANKDVYIREIGPRSIITLPFNDIGSSEAAILEFSKFDNIIEEQNLINAYETGILLKPAETGFLPACIFNTVEIVENSDASITSNLPAGEYICVCYTAENASEQTLKISDYCTKNRLEPEWMLQVELLNDVFSVESSYFELQLLPSAAR